MILHMMALQEEHIIAIKDSLEVVEQQLSSLVSINNEMLQLLREVHKECAGEDAQWTKMVKVHV